jgi:signal transduction histidine kinase
MSDSTGCKRERGSILYNLACLHLDAGDHTRAVVLLDSSIHAGYRAGEFHSVAVSLIALSSVYAAIHDTSREKSICDSACRLALKHNLKREWATASGNIARFEPDPKRAGAMLRQAIQTLSLTRGNEEEIANFMINLALLTTNPDSALVYYNQAVTTAREGHLLKVAIGAYNNMVYAYLDKNDPASATEIILNRAIPMAESFGDHDWLSTLCDTYADVLIKQGKYAESVVWLRKSTEERVLSEKTVAARQVRTLNALLELRNKDLTILEKEQQISRKNDRIRGLTTVAWVSVTIILLVLAGVLWMRQRAASRLQQMKLESARKVIEAGEHEKEMTGMELHDAIGALSLKVNETVEAMHGVDVSHSRAISRHVEDFSAAVREISHRMSGKTLEKQEIHALLITLCEETIRYGRISLQYRISEPAGPLPSMVKIHMYRVVQELMNNARKYAGGAPCSLSVVFNPDTLEIVYRDDGPGFCRDEGIDRGMGLSNIFARINLVNGTAILDTFPGNGVYWKITVPCKV